jgi:hypothetical protein
MLFLIHTMAWSGKHRCFVIEEVIQNGGLPVMTQRASRIRFTLGQCDPSPDKKKIFTIACQTSDKQVLQ